MNTTKVEFGKDTRIVGPGDPMQPSNRTSERPEMLTKTDLRARGWTASLIDTFLPTPDLEKRNPRYASAAPMKLYFLWRIENMERTAQWQQRRAVAKKRSESSSRAAATKAARLLRSLQNMTIVVPILPMNQLVQSACRHYNDMAIDREKPFRAKPTSEKAFLDRICVNYLRHELTDYEEHLEDVFGKVGVNLARSEIRTRVYSAIAELYPALASECETQLQLRLEESSRSG